jgi:hypothetical protein
MAPLRARPNSTIYFVSVGSGETDVEVLVPLDDKTGIGRFGLGARPAPYLLYSDDLADTASCASGLGESCPAPAT